MMRYQRNTGARWAIAALFVLWVLFVMSLYVYYQWQDYTQVVCRRNPAGLFCGWLRTHQMSVKRQS